jgi:hypothetical protein
VDVKREASRNLLPEDGRDGWRGVQHSSIARILFFNADENSFPYSRRFEIQEEINMRWQLQFSSRVFTRGTSFNEHSFSPRRFFSLSTIRTESQ